jgi:hypothetical protein
VRLTAICIRMYDKLHAITLRSSALWCVLSTAVSLESRHWCSVYGMALLVARVASVAYDALQCTHYCSHCSSKAHVKFL